ncbi:UNVERIFIED_CONTAM: hypothetical protein FKN15_020541 [Acipenser sinensis]
MEASTGGNWSRLSLSASCTLYKLSNDFETAGAVVRRTSCKMFGRIRGLSLQQWEPYHKIEHLGSSSMGQGTCNAPQPNGELNVLDDILTEAPDQDDELYNPESEHDINEKKGSKRKNDRGDHNDSKRPRSSGHYTRQAVKRAAGSTISSSKKPMNARGRHSSDYKNEEYHYDRSKDCADRKNHSVRGSSSRDAQKPVSRRKDSDRRIKPLMAEVPQKLRRTSVESGRASRSSKEGANSDEYGSDQETGSSASSEGNNSEDEGMDEEGVECDKVDGEEEEEDEEEEGEEEEEDEEYEQEEVDQRERNEENDYDTRSEASDSESESVSFSEGESIRSGSGSEASDKEKKEKKRARGISPIVFDRSGSSASESYAGSEKKHDKLSSSVRAVRKDLFLTSNFIPNRRFTGVRRDVFLNGCLL